MRMMMTGLCVAVLGLAGCEPFEFSEATDDDSIYLDLLDENIAMQSEIDAMNATPDAGVPVNGAATYDGTAVIGLDTPTASQLVGRATLTADFATSVVSGQMAGFYGSIGDGEVEGFDGTITVSTGLVDLAADSQVSADIDGTLVGANDVLDVDATIVGDFMGDTDGLNEPPPGIALSADGDSVFTLNGDVVTGGMDVIGLTD